MHTLLIILILFGPDPVLGQTGTEPSEKLSLLFIGDIMGHDEQIWSAENRETHTFDYNDVFRYIKPVISEADLAIANFEVTLGGPPYRVIRSSAPLLPWLQPAKMPGSITWSQQITMLPTGAKAA